MTGAGDAADLTVGRRHSHSVSVPAGPADPSAWFAAARGGASLWRNGADAADPLRAAV